jgi:hypothetical protein
VYYVLVEITSLEQFTAPMKHTSEEVNYLRHSEYFGAISRRGSVTNVTYSLVGDGPHAT